ncbi:MAG: hypothetical protein K2K55_03540 [Duncaniella sp.]|nr:hypothetical protein [Duncaniella sp.]
MTRPVIFLDFDGVLNTDRYQARLAVEGETPKDAWGPIFDPCSVANLKKIIDATEAEIVISSSWRYAHGLGSLRMMWEVRDLPGEIRGILACGATCVSRGGEIDGWLNRNGRPNYVIIDDLDDFYPSQHDHYVETNPIIGITENDTDKAIKILRNMTKEISEWNGFPVYGNVEEIDSIVETSGLINIDKEDIESVLSADGENRIITASGADISEALNAAINGLPCGIDKVNKLLIDFRYGNKQPKMSELSSIAATLGDANSDCDLIWGMSSDDTLGESCKVTVLASLKA